MPCNAALGDTDGDGIFNLIEYALLLSPASPSQLPGASTFSYVEGDRLRMFVPRDPARNDITTEVQAADSPAGPWTTLATSTLGTPFVGPGFVDKFSAIIRIDTK